MSEIRKVLEKLFRDDSTCLTSISFIDIAEPILLTLFESWIPKKKDTSICECEGGRECICENLARNENELISQIHKNMKGEK